ncbi:OmpH family outer membrane protein [uncultured Shimia sp.]|uniref:OmpH family outer membrane protein n=1 Tax=uncultured Shimia sp. TaxID=573152 RepID=UPI00261B41FA|nr:OmpH family outer membrane protein [uncultured Shimia sp.]
MKGFLRIAILLVAFASPALSQSQSQSGALPQSPILAVDSERLFSESDFGQRVARDIEAEQSVLLAENRRIESELTTEEKRLTDLRKDMSSEDFQAIADAFDARVQDIRREQDAKGRAITEMRDRQQAVFIQAARPILIELMREAGAGMIIERRTILVSTDAVDITEQAIERLNRAIGDGSRDAGDQ